MKATQTLLLAATFSLGSAFVPSNGNARQVATSSITLQFGLPSFQPKKKEDDSSEEVPVKKMDLKGLAQLVTAGMGAPFLGDFEGVDKESGKFMFSLEANNLVDEEGNSKQTSMPYFESGWVDPEDLEKEEKRKQDGFKFPWQK